MSNSEGVAWPVLVIEGGDIRLLESREELQGALEDWMVFDEAIEFFDARARRLHAVLTIDGPDVVMGPGDQERGHVVAALEQVLVGSRSGDNNDAIVRFLKGLED